MTTAILSTALILLIYCKATQWNSAKINRQIDSSDESYFDNEINEY